jgi:hypothetical protein
MKIYNKTYLPDTIKYNGLELTLNASISGAMNSNNTPPRVIIDTLKKENRIGVLVLVLHKNLRGKKDLHGNIYQPTKWIYSN